MSPLDQPIIRLTPEHINATADAVIWKISRASLVDFSPNVTVI